MELSGHSEKGMKTISPIEAWFGIGIVCLGKEIYAREGFCSTCHHHDGGGLSASLIPST